MVKNEYAPGNCYGCPPGSGCSIPNQGCSICYAEQYFCDNCEKEVDDASELYPVDGMALCFECAMEIGGDEFEPF
jgi:hypothetical protein